MCPCAPDVPHAFSRRCHTTALLHVQALRTMGLLNVCAATLLLWGSTAHAAEPVNNDDDRRALIESLYKNADFAVDGALIEPLRKEIAEGRALIELLRKEIADLKADGALIEPVRNKEIVEGRALIESLYKKIADLKADGAPDGLSGEAPQWGPWTSLDDQGRRVFSIDTCAAGEFTVTTVTCDFCPPGQFTDAFTAAAAACSACAGKLSVAGASECVNASKAGEEKSIDAALYKYFYSETCARGCALPPPRTRPRAAATCAAWTR